MNILKLILSLITSSALAQLPAPDEVIEVKGSKDGTSYYDSLSSILILSKEELTANGRSNNLQVLNVLPNVSVNKNGESFSIRGINSSGVTGYQKDNLASIIIDEVFQTDLAIQSGSFNLWDMERIEVLRGAQSTHQGVNSLAGSIVLEHKKASEHLNEGEAKVGLGNFWNREAGLTVNNILIPNKMGARISYDREMNKGYIKNTATANENWGDGEHDRLHLNTHYKISNQDSLYFDAKLHRRLQGGTYVQGQNPFEYQVNENEDYNSRTKNHQLSLNYQHEFSDSLSTIAIVGFSKSGQSLLSDADGTAQNTAGVRIEDREDRYVSFENRLLYKSSVMTHLLGLHFHDFELDETHDFDLLFPLSATSSTPVSAFQTMTRKRKALALYHSTTYDWSEHHSFVAGLRGEYVDTEFKTGVAGQRLDDLGGGNAAIDAYIASISGEYGGSNSNFVMLPRLGYLFKTGPHHAGFSFARAYRTAGVSINRRRAQAVEYRPEYTNNYELSYKRSGRDLQLSASMFYIDWSAQQVQVQLSGDIYDTQVTNAARSAVYGAEIETRARLTSTQSLTAGVGHTVTRFNEFQTRTTDYKGNKFPFASPWTARLTHEARLFDKLTFFSIIRYASSAFSNAENTRSSEEQFYFDFMVHYAFASSVNFEAYVNNALDGRYLLVDGTPSSSTSPYQSRYHQVSTPREFGARLNYFW